MQVDINKILELYRNRVAELEHELIMQIAKNVKLEELLDEDEK